MRGDDDFILINACGNSLLVIIGIEPVGYSFHLKIFKGVVSLLMKDNLITLVFFHISMIKNQLHSFWSHGCINIKHAAEHGKVVFVRIIFSSQDGHNCR